MKIKGLQKITLIDYPGKIGCTIFLFGCNFRCGFCHNPELVIRDDGNYFSEEEILNFLDKRKKYLDAVCISGGEPLLTLEFDFLRKIREKGYLVKIDTNGSFPERLRAIIDQNLVDFIAMDIKSSREKYDEITNTNVEIKKIEDSIKIISDFPNYEFRTTILEKYHSEEDFREMMNWLKQLTGKKLKKFCLQGFKNSGKLINEKLDEKNTSESYLLNLKKIAEEYFDEVEVRV
jgi:pyruvate formate lyase activating enzyme